VRYLLHDVFTTTVTTLNDKIAIVQEDGSAITYGRLNSRSNQFANYFRDQKTDIRSRPYVGILSPVNIDSIAACLGILKVGGAYVPLDEFSPDGRLMTIVENTGLDLVVVDPHQREVHRRLLEHPNIKTVVVLADDINEPRANEVDLAHIAGMSAAEPPALNQVSDDLAYVLHSSGSTGVPKGIMLTHRNARTFVDWMHKKFQLTTEDVVMSRAPFKFDLSVFDIFNTFKAGASLVCYDWNERREGDVKHADYVRLMEKQGATILYTTPSTFISLMNRGGLADAEMRLRQIMYAGEPFPTPQLRKLRDALPKARIANIYGPTETNIVTHHWVDSIPENDAPVPLGRVVDDTEIIVVDNETNRLCGPNELGELWCRGGTVTLGYLGLEEKTRACLVRSPFHRYPAHFWRTGDYGFYDEMGLLHYRGRKDGMVKVKGFRIELGEIENALAKNPLLDEFAVVAVPDEKYTNRLYCYYSVLGDALTPESEFTPETLKEFIATLLPEYMVPFACIPRETLPKTSSGKIDRMLLQHQSLEDEHHARR
jgi:amino acid adenylation domain-containing protein